MSALTYWLMETTSSSNLKMVYPIKKSDRGGESAIENAEQVGALPSLARSLRDGLFERHQHPIATP